MSNFFIISLCKSLNGRFAICILNSIVWIIAYSHQSCIQEELFLRKEIFDYIVYLYVSK